MSWPFSVDVYVYKKDEPELPEGLRKSDKWTVLFLT